MIKKSGFYKGHPLYKKRIRMICTICDHFYMGLCGGKTCSVECRSYNRRWLARKLQFKNANKLNQQMRERRKSPIYRDKQIFWNNKWKLKFPDRVRLIKQVAQSKRQRLLKGKITTNQWFSLKQKFKFTCLCCGRKEPEIRLSIDHVIAIKYGGKHCIENIQPLCRSCNSRKHTQSTDFRLLFET